MSAAINRMLCHADCIYTKTCHNSYPNSSPNPNPKSNLDTVIYTYIVPKPRSAYVTLTQSCVLLVSKTHKFIIIIIITRSCHAL
jgi:hypothetical protein